MRVAAAARRFSVPSHHIRYLRRTGLLSAAGPSLDLADLVRLQFIARCRKRRVSLQRIRRFFASTGGRAEGVDSGGRPMLLDSSHLVVREADQLIDPSTGQTFFDYRTDGEAPSAGNVLEFARHASEGGREARLGLLESRFQEALASSDEGEVRSILEEILGLSPDHSGALIELGNLAFEHGEYADAERYYDRAIARAPDCVEAIYNLANVYFRQRKYAAAIRAYQTSLTLDPDFPEAYYNLALVYFSLQHWERAGHFFRCYLELDPESGWRGQAEEFLAEIESAEAAESPRLFGDK